MKRKVSPVFHGRQVETATGLTLQAYSIGRTWGVQWGVCTDESEEARDRWVRFLGVRRRKAGKLTEGVVREAISDFVRMERARPAR